LAAPAQAFGVDQTGAGSAAAQIFCHIEPPFENRLPTLTVKLEG
jgi:hypothetical protein